MFVLDSAIKKGFPVPLEYAKDQNIIGTKEISGKWKKGNFLVFTKGPPASPTLQGSVYMTPATPTRS